MKTYKPVFNPINIELLSIFVPAIRINNTIQARNLPEFFGHLYSHGLEIRREGDALNGLILNVGTAHEIGIV